jgi:Tfp pilus assembly protein PilF
MHSGSLFSAGLGFDAEFCEALTNLGLLRKQAGALAEAESCYKLAIVHDPGNRFKSHHA